MARIFIAGHNGMVGGALVKQLSLEDNHLLTASRAEVDLTRQAQVEQFLQDNKVDQVYLAAAKVGGIYANNTYPAEFIYQNLMIQSHIIHSAFNTGVQKLLFLGSSCIYPKHATQPIVESELLNGHLEETNEPYAIAKIAGIKMCESYNRQYGTDYRSVMPTNLYGPGDNYHPENSHVIPALIRKFHEAKVSGAGSVVVWGTGAAKREFLYVDDMASASIFVMGLSNEQLKINTRPNLSHLNVGSGIDCSIKSLALEIAYVVGFTGQLVWDTSKPDGAPRKLMDSSSLTNLGWRPTYDLRSGLEKAYKSFIETSFL